MVRQEVIPMVHGACRIFWFLKLFFPENAARRQAANRLRKDLKRDDLDRRIKEAEATIEELKPLLDKANADREKQKPETER